MFYFLHEKNWSLLQTSVIFVVFAKTTEGRVYFQCVVGICLLERFLLRAHVAACAVPELAL